MITDLWLENFKSFKKARVDLRAITLLAGLNGMGKSSLMQAILLLRQSFLSGDLQADRLLLNGELTGVGSSYDLLFEDADSEVVVFGFSFDGRGGKEDVEFAWECQLESGTVARKWMSRVELYELAKSGFPLFSDKFCYVQAERIGPRKMTELSAARARMADIGARGEYVNHVLLVHGDKLLEEDDPRLHPAADSRRLLDQVNAWLHEISPGSYINIETVAAADIAVPGFKFDREGDVRSRVFRATNVGFGLTYALPVIVSLLTGQKGGLLLLENPEAHVHPKGQTMLGRLAARASSIGLQVIVETHSDHFMDGVRIEVRVGGVKPEDCSFIYFTRTDGETSTQQPVLGPDGRLSFWPDGFFDEREKNLATIISGVEAKSDA